MRLTRTFFLLALVLAGALGCNRGYRSVEDLESGELGPRHCAARCTELGLEMGAFVFVQHHYAGCVCQPVATSGGAQAGGVTVGAGAVLIAAEARRQQEQQAQQQQQQN